tara:strand:+ start:176 stop:712 length:537 start_codon:yes stop_codon:yes gene_type:complete
MGKFKLKGFPEHCGVSPMKNVSNPNEVFADTNYDTDPTETKTTGESVDNSRNIKKVEEAIKQGDQTQKANTKYEDGGNIIEEPKGIDRWIDKPIMDVLGLSKKARAARKERKAQKISDAKAAEGEGTETLKQAKLVKRAKKREDRALKRKSKDQKKLKKFREKNPVTGKEAIKLATKE